MKERRSKKPEKISVIWEPPDPDERALDEAFRMLFESRDPDSGDQPGS